MNEEIDRSIEQKRASFGNNGSNIAIIAFGVLVLAGGVFAGLKYAGTFDHANKISNAHFITYRTQGKVELYESKSTGSNVRANLKEGSIVSGKPVGNVDGVEWAEVTSVDGVHGFTPMGGLQKVGEGADLSQVQDSIRRVVTSTSINLRSTPSMSGSIIGYIDGGTRITTDGYVSSQGEDWLRIRLADKVGFIMARFTTPDDDRTGNNEGFASSKVGVSGTVKIVSNIQATPYPDGRVLRSVMEGDSVGVLGQTKTDDWWYIVRLDDGTQGFIPKTSIIVSEKQGKWVYPDGTEAPGPNVPQGQKTPINPNAAQGKKDVSADNPVKVDFNETPNPVDTPPNPIKSSEPPK